MFASLIAEAQTTSLSLPTVKSSFVLVGYVKRILVEPFLTDRLMRPILAFLSSFFQNIYQKIQINDMINNCENGA